MASIIPGFEYDIFISYRQKDNKGSKWVSEFVEAIRVELESTFKEEISVYFDVDPHDGLLESHDVYDSLKEKLRCLIFLPVISRTYCDPKSYAWEHEFKAFVEQASEDKFGLKIKIPGGNVANRVLPVFIHDLDNDDLSLWESVIGSPIRGIEFIYKESGVNKPLTFGDDEKKNLNHTKYGIQINRTANAIREIIAGLKTISAEPGKEKYQNRDLPDENGIAALKEVKNISLTRIRRKTLFAFIFICLVSFLIIILYPKYSRHDTLAKLRSSGEKISVVVMPFRNMTNDSTWNIWQDGIQYNMTTSLSNSEELKVSLSESTNYLLHSKGFNNYALITPAVAKTISQNLNAEVFVFGSINQAGDKIRISTQLIDSKTESIFKSFQINGDAGKILEITDSLSSLIRSYLTISVLEKEISGEFKTSTPNSVESYRTFILGYKAFFGSDNISAIKYFSDAIKIDSGFIDVYVWLSLAYGNQGSYDQAKLWCQKAYAKRDQLSFDLRIYPDLLHARYIERSVYEEIKVARRLLELNDQLPISHYVLGSDYFVLQQYSAAIPELEATIGIYKKWNTKPLNAYYYEELIDAYHEVGNYKKEKDLLAQALTDFPEDLGLISSQIILLFAEKDSVAANQYLMHYISLSKNYSFSDSRIATSLANIYSASGMYDKAEDNYRKALALDPDNVLRLNNLAYFLINNKRNIVEGMSLIDKALISEPDNYLFLDTKGWGLYKLGRSKEALQILEKSWDLRPVYDHRIYLHLEDVKKAVGS
jgi:tetratricopeptide (TPR) repeat protein